MSECLNCILAGVLLQRFDNILITAKNTLNLFLFYTPSYNFVHMLVIWIRGCNSVLG